MFSAWAKSWGLSWGDSWGTVKEAISVGGGVGKGSARKRTVVVEYDGKEYRIQEQNLQAFLESIQQKVEDTPPAKAVKKTKRKKLVPVTPPEVIVKSAPAEIIKVVQQQVDYANDIISNTLQGAAIKYFAEQTEEEELILLMV